MNAIQCLPDHKQIQGSTEAWPVTQGWRYEGVVMSNCGREIEPDGEEKLRSGKFYAHYSAWNFHGQVWFYDGEFHCHVNRYRSHIATVSAKSLVERRRTRHLGAGRNRDPVRKIRRHADRNIEAGPGRR